MPNLNWQAALLRDLYEHDKASGEFDPRTLLSRELSSWDRGVAEFGRGIGQGLTLGFADRFNDESLDTNPGHFDWTDAVNLTGNIVGTLPAAVVTGGLAAAGGRAIAPQLAARAGLLGMLGRGVAFASAEAPEGAGLGMRMLHGAAQNVLEGAPLNAIEVGRQVAQEDEFDPTRIAATSGANLLADVVFGAGFGGLRRPRVKGSTAAADELVEVPPDVEATVQTTGQGATPASEAPGLGFEEPRGTLLLPPGRPDTPPGAIWMGPPAPPPPEWLVNLERNAWYPPQESTAGAPGWLRSLESAPYRYPRRFRDGSLGINPRPMDAAGPPTLDADVLGFEDAPPEPVAGALPRRASLALPPGAEGTPEGVFTPPPPPRSVAPVPTRGPVERTFRRAPASSPPPAPAAEPVPVNAELAAQAAGRRAPVLNPQEAQVVGLGFDEPVGQVAPAANGGAPEPTVPGAAPVVDERAFKSKEARGIAQAVNAAGADKMQLFGLLANLSDAGVLRNSPDEKAALQQAIAARMGELPDAVRPARAAPPAPEAPPARPTEAAPAPAAGGRTPERERLRAAEDFGRDPAVQERAKRIAKLAVGRVDDSLTRYGAEGAAILRMHAHPDWTDEQVAVDIARHYRPRDPGLGIARAATASDAAPAPAAQEVRGAAAQQEPVRDPPRGARVRGRTRSGEVVEGRFRLSHGWPTLFTDDGHQIHIDRVDEVLDPSPVPVLNAARRTDVRRAFDAWFDAHSPYAGRKADRETRGHYYDSWRTSVDHAELGLPKPTDGNGQGAGYDWRMSLPDARARSDAHSGSAARGGVEPESPMDPLGGPVPRGALVRGVDHRTGRMVEGRVLEEAEASRKGGIHKAVWIVGANNQRTYLDGDVHVVDPSPLPILKARRKESSTAFEEWWENMGPYSDDVKSGHGTALERDTKPHYRDTWREGVERAELGMPRPADGGGMMAYSAGWDWRMAQPDASARASAGAEAASPPREPADPKLDLGATARPAKNPRDHKVKFLGGETGGKTAAELQQHGFGRVLVERDYEPYPGEPQALDNGAYRQFSEARRRLSEEYGRDVSEAEFFELGTPGVKYDFGNFVSRYNQALERSTRDSSRAPLFAVIPDEVGNAEKSLDRSVEFLHDLNYERDAVEADPIAFAHGLRHSPVPLYLSVQNGMTPASVEAALWDSVGDRSFVDDLAGIFLGGSKDWKRDTAAGWVRWAKEKGLRVHYGRASTQTDLETAYRAGVNSADSADWQVRGAIDTLARTHSRFEREAALVDRGAAPDGPVNLFGEREQPVVEQTGMFGDRDFAAGDKAAADRITGRKMTADEIVANTRADGRDSLEGGEGGLFDEPDDTPDVPDLGGAGGPTAAVLAPPKKRKARGITPVRTDHVDTPPEGAADNAVYHKVRDAARGIPDDELRERYLRNLRQNIDAGSDAEARPSRVRRIDREDKDVPIYKPVSAGAERSRWNRTNSEARLVAYSNELRARGLEEPHPDDAFRDVAPDDVPERLRPLMQEVREAETADELRTMLYGAERRAMRDPHAVVDRAVIAGEMRARGIPTSTREMVDAGDYTGALYAKVLPNGPGLGHELRGVLESHIDGASELSDRELVQRAVRQGVVDNPTYRAAVSVLDDYGFWRVSGRLAFDPLMGAALGIFGGGIVGGRLDKDHPLRGALAGATAGAFLGAGLASGGALAARVLREARAAGAARDVRLARDFRDELRAGTARGEVPRVSMDDPRLQLETPRARRRRNPGGIGFPLPHEPAEPQHAGGGFWRVVQNERGAWDLTPEEVDAVTEPRVQLEERPRGLGIVETWLRSPRDLFAKYDQRAAEVADLAARALDEKKRFLDMRRVQVQTAMAGLTRADKGELWRALDKHAVVSDVPMQVGKRVRDAFVTMRRLFREDVVRLFEMRRDLLNDADRKTLDDALDAGMRESTLPDDFPEHLRPLVAMNTGEWGIAAYWPHVFDGNWKVHAGEHTNYFNSRNEAESYAQRLLHDGKWNEDIPVTYTLAVTGDMAAALPRDRYFRLVDQLRSSLGLNRGSVVSKIDGTVRVGAPKRFLAHERQRAVDLQTFVQDPEKALDLYYHRWASKLAFDPFRVRSSELLGKVDKKVVGLVDEVDDYIRRVQGLPGKNELAFDHSVQRSLLWLTHGLLETKPFLARRAASRITEAMAFAKLGFSPVSAALNLTQTIINTAPHVGEKWAVRGAREAAGYLASRMRGAVDPEIESILREAGALTLDPKHLLGDSGAQRVASLWSRTRYASMYMFDAAERTNRVIAALAAFRKAQSEGMGRGAAIEYSREVQRKTQFRYDAADAPKLAAGPLGKVVGQFQVYALKELEFMGDLARRDPKAFTRAMGYYAALTGVRGLLVGTPLWALDAVAGQLGIVGDDNGVKERPSEWAAEHLPGPLVFGAIGTLLGSDVSERMGAGTARDFTEGKEGPAVGTLLDLYRARQSWADGDTDRAAYFLKRTAPTFLSRLLTAFQMYETQEMRDSWGRTVRPASTGDAVRTGIGVRGWDATREWDRESIRRRDQDARADAANRARNRVFDALDRGDVDAAYEALSQAQEEGNPISPAEIKSGYTERRSPQIRAIRRTRGADRNRLLDAGILERP